MFGSMVEWIRGFDIQSRNALIYYNYCLNGKMHLVCWASEPHHKAMITTISLS